MNQELLKQAIEDARAVKCLVLAWNEPPQFWGVMGYDDKGNVVRHSCHCAYCHKELPLETSASHAEICKVPLAWLDGSFSTRLKEKI